MAHEYEEIVPVVLTIEEKHLIRAGAINGIEFLRFATTQIAEHYEYLTAENILELYLIQNKLKTNIMELFKIVVSENSKMVYKSVQGTRLNAVNETMRNVRMSRYKPKEGNSWFISIEQQYIDQCGCAKLKYKNGTFALNRSFVIHSNEFDYKVLEEEMLNRFVKK